MKHKAMAILLFLVTFALEAQGQQMSPEQIQQLMQQQQRGDGGSALATPNRVGELTLASSLEPRRCAPICLSSLPRLKSSWVVRQTTAT